MEDSASAGVRKDYVHCHRDVIQRIQAKETQYLKQNIEKALCSTGHKDYETTLKWLQSHKDDPHLSGPSEREYILFLCPTGPLLSEVSKFYDQSFSRCGSNSAHNLFPHVTLSSFFQVSDSALPRALNLLSDTVERTSSLKPEKLNLTLQWCEGFIGLFLCEQSSSWLNDFINTFVKIAHTELGVLIKPQTTQFHLTLAYNFELSKTEELSQLARNVKIDAPVRWELNLYSRDSKYNGKQFQVALHDYKAKKPDEIDLYQNRFVVMETEPTTHKGWRKGIDFDTGKLGFFPESFTKKTAEWRLWTKNLSLPVTSFIGRKGPDDSKGDNFLKNRCTQSMNLKRDRTRKDNTRSSLRTTGSRDYSGVRSDTPSKSSFPSFWEPTISTSTSDSTNISTPSFSGSRINSTTSSLEGTTQQNVDNLSRKLSAASTKSDPQRDARSFPSTPKTAIRSEEMKSLKRVDRENTSRLLQQVQLGASGPASVSSSGSSIANQSTNPRRLFLMRHAERVDLTFGHDWFQVYIDEKGYHRRNLNLPRRIPTRRGGPKEFFMDGPISEIGTFQAKLIGEAFRAKCVSFSHVFASPSLRCVQTATSLLEGLMDTHTEIKIEPALFEWTAWCRNNLPKFMSVDELSDYGFNVDKKYVPFYKFSQFNLYEKTDEYYFRSHSFVENELKNTTGDILIVGHSATLDVCSRQLTGQPVRKTDDLIRVVQKVPFCGICTLEESSNPRKWNFVQGPIPSLAHGQNSTFDWRILETTVNGPPYGKGK